MLRISRLAALLATVATLAVSSARADTKLLRFPDIHGDWVVFTYAGDLWRAPVSGGTAVRLTAHPGLELFAKVSPDGQWIAFTGQYDGDEQVYVMPAAGGEPRQLTFYPARGPLPARWGYDNQVYGWSADSKRILFRSLRESPDVKTPRLYTIDRDGGLPAPLPMREAGAGALSPDGQKVFYSPLFRDFRTWKRYQGGWAQDLYVFDRKSGTARQITSDPRTDRDPMWLGNKLYFVSDRSDYLNLYVTDPQGGEARALTAFKGQDVRWPSDDGDHRIVFELDGALAVVDVTTGSVTPLAITVPDDGTRWRPETVDASRAIEDYDLSPDAERLVITARGDVFSAPASEGLTRNLTRTPGVHERETAWSPDGKWIAYVSDASGEEEVHVIPADGSAPAVAVTKGIRTRYLHPVWSPDSRKLAVSDKNRKIFIIDRARGTQTEIATDGAVFGPADYRWSPDGRYLAFTLGEPNGLRSLHIHDSKDGRQTRVTDPAFGAASPAWSPDGRYLYFLADRSYIPVIDNLEFDYARAEQTGIFALALTRAAPNPFAPRNDDVGQNQDDGKDDDGKAGSKPALTPVRIDFDGLAARVVRVPVEPGNYSTLTVTGEALLFLDTGPAIFEDDGGTDAILQSLSLKDRKVKSLAKDIEGYSLAPSGKAVALRTKAGFSILKLGDDAKPQPVPLDGLKTTRVPRAEWAEIFDEVWRRYRDHFYVANMHGYDWDAIGRKYRALLPYVGHRADLNYIMGEMIAELNVSHAYVAGGDLGLPTRPRTGTLGAVLSPDAKSGRYRIDRILQGQNEEERFRSPLTEVGVDVRPGDYILAINGQDLSAPANPYALLRGTAGRTTELLVNTRPEARGARRVLVTPLASDRDLLYLDMVLGNRAHVEKASGGRIGYLYLPDMGADGLAEFIKWYPSVIRKDALIIDVRGNGGGEVSQMVIERLQRKLLSMSYPRNGAFAATYPEYVHVGPKIALLNETSASDGDIFPWTFRQTGLGPLVGKRSWGGVVGIGDRGPLLDGGSVSVPEFGTASATGQWVIEGEGVHPDIEVANDPASVSRGEDPQLDRAITEMLKALETVPHSLPRAAPAPVKTPNR